MSRLRFRSECIGDYPALEIYSSLYLMQFDKQFSKLHVLCRCIIVPLRFSDHVLALATLV